MQIRSVSQVTRQIKSLIDSEPEFHDIWIEGEISNYKQAASGHCYFTLKDNAAEIRCVMWKSAARRLCWEPTQGDLVSAHGSVGVYERGGNYQFYVDSIQESGSQGMLWLQYQELKAQLEAEGLFDAARKRPLPAWPKRIGMVTSATGAALRDMLNILQARYPLVEVVLASSLVQGQQAPAELVQAIQRLGNMPDIDVVIVARGGGSLEDLWAFNDEGVARAIVACPHPVVSGVGHETDFTITDFCADLRTPTPTAAAAAVVPDRKELSRQLGAMLSQVAEQFTARLAAKRALLSQMERELSFHDPRRRLTEQRQRVDELSQRGERAIRHYLAMLKTLVRQKQAQLEAVSPAQILARGYGFVQDAETGLRLQSVSGARIDQRVDIHFVDGHLETRVESIQGDGLSRS